MINKHWIMLVHFMKIILWFYGMFWYKISICKLIGFIVWNHFSGRNVTIFIDNPLWQAAIFLFCNNALLNIDENAVSNIFVMWNIEMYFKYVLIFWISVLLKQWCKSLYDTTNFIIYFFISYIIPSYKRICSWKFM